MHWHILGAGAIGCIWAAQLYKSKHDVTLILRSKERLQQLKQNKGVIYQSLDDCTDVFTSNIEAELASADTPIHHLLICTKAYASLTALQSVAHRLTPDAHIILLQNGLGPQQEAADTYPEHAIWAATTTDGAYLSSPFNVVRAGYGETLIGPLSPRAKQENSAISPTPAGNLKITSVNDIERRLWCKVAINAAINPLTAIHNCKNGVLATDPVLSEKMREVCIEVESIAAACGQTLFDKPLFEIAASVATSTAENYSSMQQDVKNNRPTEIEQITGFLCKQARKFALSTPVNSALLQQIQQGQNP